MGDLPMSERRRSRYQAEIREAASARAALLTRIRSASPRRTEAEWGEDLSTAGRRALRDFLTNGTLAIVDEPRPDASGRRYLRKVVAAPVPRAPERGLFPQPGAHAARARRLVGMSVAELAGRLGVSESGLRRMEASYVPGPRVTDLEAALGLRSELSPDRARRIRLETGWRLEEVARRVGVSVSTLSEFERGAPAPSVFRDLVALAATLYEALSDKQTRLDALRVDFEEEIVAEVRAAGQAGVTPSALAHRHSGARLGKFGPSLVTDAVVRDLEKSKPPRLVRRLQPVEMGSGGRPRRDGAQRSRMHRTEERLFAPEHAPAEASGRLCGSGVKERRIRAGARQSELASLVGVDVGTERAWEHRKDKPVPLRWEAALEDALRTLEDRGDPDKAAEATANERIPILLKNRPGAYRAQLARALRGPTFTTLTKPERRALSVLIRDGDVVDEHRRFFLKEHKPVRLTSGELRERMRAGAWTVPQVATAIGVHRQTVVRWVSGQRTIPYERVTALRALLDQPAPHRRGYDWKGRLMGLVASGPVVYRSLPDGFFRPRGQAALAEALAKELVHIEERIEPRADGQLRVRRYVVVGPGGWVPALDAIAPDELRAARLSAGLTQAELARRAGVHEAKVSSWECGRERVPPARVAAVRAALMSSG